MKQSFYELSVEELAFAMGVLDGSDVAAGFLLAILGQRSKDEMDGRLLAAGHSLLARGYLTLDMESREKQLVETLRNMVQGMLDHDLSIRVSRAALGQERILSYFFQRAGIVEHRTRQEVVSLLQSVDGFDAVLDRIRDFLSLASEPGIVDDSSILGTVPFELLEQAKDLQPGTGDHSMHELLAQANLPASVAREIAEDYLALEYRGSVIRIERRDGQGLSDQGFLLLKAPRRFWIFEIVPEDPPLTRVFRGTPQRFRKCVAALLNEQAGGLA